MGSNIAITLLALLFSAFFSGYEIAFLQGNKLKVELDRKQGKRYANIMQKFIKNPERLISSLLVGNNVAIVIYGMAIAKILDPLIAKYITASVGGILAIDTIVATIIVLITAEFLPKAMCRMNPNGVFSSLYWLFLFFYWLFYPITFITNKLSGVIMKLFGVKEEDALRRNLRYPVWYLPSLCVYIVLGGTWCLLLHFSLGMPSDSLLQLKDIAH